MHINRVKKESFTLIGVMGSSEDGDGFIKGLWDKLNSQFDEISPLAKKDEDGTLVGIWGAMSDFTLSFAPWEDDFSKGLYLAGVEVDPEAQPPKGWDKWTLPAYEYLYTKSGGEYTFSKVIDYLEQNDLSLAGATHDYCDPKDGQFSMYFPIKLL